MVGDIMQRIGDHSRIQSFLTGSLLSIMMATVTFVVYAFIMGGYNMKILGIFMLGSIFYIVWVLLFMKKRRKLDYMRFQEASANQSSIVQLITGMQDIKLNGCEKQKRWEWERIQARLFNVSVKGLILGQIQQVGGTFIDQTKIFSFLFSSKSCNKWGYDFRYDDGNAIHNRSVECAYFPTYQFCPGSSGRKNLTRKTK